MHIFWRSTRFTPPGAPKQSKHHDKSLFPQKIHPNLDEVYQIQTKKTEGK
jgi:hypothetical protein